MDVAAGKLQSTDVVRGGASWRQGSAGRLEASDDLLLRIFRGFTVVERLRLAAVSKRWQRLLLAELVFKEVDKDITRRLQQIIRWAGDALTRLDISALECEVIRWREIILQLCDHCPNLKELVMWAEDKAPPPQIVWGVDPEMARRLAAQCPLLEETSRVVICWNSFADGIAVLDALPGRHGLHFEQTGVTAGLPTGNPLDIDSLPAVLTHRRAAHLRSS